MVSKGYSKKIHFYLTLQFSCDFCS